MYEAMLASFCAIVKTLRYFSFYNKTFSAGNLSIVETFTFVERVAFVENTRRLFL